MIIKICGIRTLDDALVALEAGANMLGFNFYPPSPRYISCMECAHLQAGLSNRGLDAVSVGVFVNETPESIEEIMEDCNLHLAQLSGDEAPEIMSRLNGVAYKALRLSGVEQAHREIARYARAGDPPAFLLDAHQPGLYGGTGRTGNWSLARELAEHYPFILAGGLNPDNIAPAIRQVRPWGVDVATGVESAPGRKDPQKIAALVNAVHQVEQEGLHAENVP